MSSSSRGFVRAMKFFDIVTHPQNTTFDKIPLLHCSNLTQIARGKSSSSSSSSSNNEENKMRAQIEEENGIRCDLYVHESLCNRFGTLHGGCIATIVDVLTTCALLVDDENSEKGGGVTTDLHVSCVKSARMHSTVTVEAISKRLGKTMGFSQCELRDENGAVVAYGTHTKFLGITGPKL